MDGNRTWRLSADLAERFGLRGGAVADDWQLECMLRTSGLYMEWEAAEKEEGSTDASYEAYVAFLKRYGFVFEGADERVWSNPVSGVLVDVNHEVAYPLTIEGRLESYYEVLGCSCIDIAFRKVGDVAVDIICDDEGLLAERPKVSACNAFGEPMLCGNLFVCSCDEDGRTVSLPHAHMLHVMNQVERFASTRFPEPYPMLTNVGYA